LQTVSAVIMPSCYLETRRSENLTNIIPRSNMSLVLNNNSAAKEFSNKITLELNFKDLSLFYYSSIMLLFKKVYL